MCFISLLEIEVLPREVSRNPMFWNSLAPFLSLPLAEQEMWQVVIAWAAGA